MRRLRVLLDAPAGAIDFAHVAEPAHATDDIVISEIESWQAVFGGKHITVPICSAALKRRSGLAGLPA